LNPAVVDNDVRNLYATGLFYSVRAAQQTSPEGISLTYILQENPRLMAIKFNGNANLSDRQLRSKLTSHVGGPLHERSLFTDSQRLQETYHGLGYPDARVQYSYTTEQETGRSTVIFQIAEGLQARQQH
jgi:outer membrane protein assembly factor BamA